ncbi:MAG: DegT/DnrJ/EryC1/StrS family aminotransferase, partial [Gemmatimonadales bacterium]
DMAGATVRLYDLDPGTLGPEPESLARALELGVDCVVIVHAFGLAVDHRKIGELIAGHDVTVIEDAAQAAGGSYNGHVLGSLDTLAVLSFGRGKGITAGGGGALLGHGARGASLLARVAPLVKYGIRGMAGWVKTTAQWALARPAIYAVPSALPFLHLGATLYNPPHPVRQLSNAAAGILLRTMGTIDREARIRRRNAAAISSAVTSGRFAPIPPEPGAEPGYLRLPVLAPISARHEIDDSVARMGVMPGYPVPLHRLGGFDRVASPGEYPGAEKLADRLLTVPVHGKMSVADLDKLSRWLSDGRAGVRSAGIRE